MRLSLVAGLLIAATIVPGAADAGPVRAAAAGTTTAVTVTGRTAVRGTVVVGTTAAKGTAVVGRTAVRGTAAAGRGLARGTVCVAPRVIHKPHLNSASDSAASTPPVIAISANGVLSAISASVTMICPILAASSAIEAP